MTNIEYKDLIKTAIEAFNKVYYNKGDFYGGSFWVRAEILEVLEDAYQIIGGEEYKNQIDEICQCALKISSKDWIKNPFNDDIAWMCLAFARAGVLLGNEEYLQIAKDNLDRMWERAWDDEICGGGMYWKVGVNSKHTVTVCPSSIAACILGKYYNDSSYYDKAIKAMEWQINTLYDKETGRVYDKIFPNGQVDQPWDIEVVYNIGSFVGACTMLYEYTKDEQYLNYATKAVSRAKNSVYEGGLMTCHYEEIGVDGAGFRGIFARWIRYYAECAGDSDTISWLKENGELALSNRNRYNLMSHKIGEKTQDYYQYNVFSCASALSICINGILPEIEE